MSKASRVAALMLAVFHLAPCRAQQAPHLTFVELNCENLFDCQHDTLKQDYEYLPDALRRWTYRRYRTKLDNIAREILSCQADGIPDLVALCEVENDSVLHDLTRRSLLRGAGYDYLMTHSPDLRGIDVALLYSPSTFAPICHRSIHVTPTANMRPTRDILYVSGRILSGDTLHIFVVHAPSRYGGEHHSRPFRLRVAETLTEAIDSVTTRSPAASIIVAGDFNDYDNSPALKLITRHGVSSITKDAKGENGTLGTYRHQGDWRSLDHILLSPPLRERVERVYIHAPLFLLDEDPRYGGYRPRRTYNGMRYQPGYSDHLPLVVSMRY